jgi:hypothetical protein
MASHPNNKKILYGVLNWGLGHATRSYQLIEELNSKDNQVIIASSGIALSWLKDNFPENQFLELPNYQIEYPKSQTSSKKAFALKLLKQQGKIRRTINQEKKLCAKWVSEFEIDLVYSDHCLGFYSSKTPSYVVAHQINILAPYFNKWVNRWHQNQLKKFNKILIPDYPDQRLSGKLSTCDFMEHEFIGPLSRMKGIKSTGPNIAIFISGPEPHRSYFEAEIIAKIQTGVIGTTESEIHIWGAKNQPKLDNVVYQNGNNWDKILLESCGTWYSRSGYTSIMDAYVCGAKLISKPTPGQVEQEYLRQF